jgi:hypothetical protein
VSRRSEEPFYAPFRAPARPRQPKPGERLFELLVGHNRYLFERRDHGDVYGVECQIFKNEELLMSRRFDPRLDASRPSREMAIAWAEEERKAMEKAGA